MKLKLPDIPLPFLGRSGSLLVCETDGFMLHAAVVGRSGSELALLHGVTAQAGDLQATVAAAVKALQREGWKPGGKAVLLTPGVVPSLLELPVNPGKARSAAQMQALVGYELEPMLLEHTTLWSMGRMLVGTGAMTREQAREIIELQAGRNANNASDREMEIYTFKRFGDLAMEAGYITRPQLDEALQRQAWFRLEADDIACGWSPQAGKEMDGTQAPWLATGAGRQAIQHWVQAFSAQGIRLDALYPLAGCSLAALPPGAQQPALVMEVRAGVMMGGRVSDGHVEALYLHKPSGAGSDLDHLLEVYHQLMPPDAASIWLAGVGPAAERLAAELAEMIQRPVALLPTVGGSEAGLTSGMAGAARHAFGLAGGTLACEIPAAGPRIPIWQQPQFRLFAGGLLLLALIGVAEAVVQMRQHLVAGEHARIAGKAAEFDAAKARIQAEIDKIKAAKDKIKGVQDEMAQVERRMGFYGGTLAERAVLVQLLLEELARSVTVDVVVDRIEETPRDGFRIYAWSITERGATQFVQTFKDTMASWDVVVEDVSMMPQQGRYNLPGFAVKFEAVAAPASAADDEVAAPGKDGAVAAAAMNNQKAKP